MISSYPITYFPIGGQIPMQVSDDAGKIFVGGIPAETTKESLTEYFQQFGDVSDSIIMVDNITSRSRGFGFVTFVDPNSVNKVLAHSRHCIHGKVVDAKKAVPKGPNQGNILRAMYLRDAARNGITSNRADRNPDCKVFVGGVAQGTTESDLESHFQLYGNVLEVKIPKDQNTHRARGFSFVLFEDRESVLAATKERYQKINGKTVEVKTVHIQPAKDDNIDADSQIQSPSLPYVQYSQRPGFYQTYPSGFLGVGVGHSGGGISPQNFYESTYEPSPSGSTSSAASIGSAGYGARVNAWEHPQRMSFMEEYPYMASLYPAMNDLLLSPQQQYALRSKRFIPRQFSPAALSYSIQPSTSVDHTNFNPTPTAFQGDPVSYGSSSFSTIPAAPVHPFIPGSNPQSVSLQGFASR
ncbi:RNA-binding protein Musashi homolog 1 isoform X3 [Hydra vulgaris]|uniref:RNA-binding protein Musashi homolog 1 isoform X3 n=1 Tax=Hydra vulgaris TaxID=6087 RepID=A0ABM4DD65_HYDVU